MTPTTTPEKSKLSAAQKKAFLEERLRRRTKDDDKPASTIPVRPQPTPVPLSYAQEGMWYLEQLQPDTATYNMAYAWRLQGPLDGAALTHSLNTIVQRHEALRTRFDVVEGEPLQIIAAAVTLSLTIVNLQPWPASERDTQAEKLVNEEAQHPFDLTQAPLLRATLLQLAPTDHVLLLTVHHLVSDGWSSNLLLQELTIAYRAFAAGQTTAPLPALPIQYADFAVWQREQLSGDKQKKSLAYWREQLAGALPVLEMPTDYPRPATQSYKGARLTKSLSPVLSQALKTLGQKENATPFMTLLAGFNLLLQRYTGQNDIVVGTPMINRNRTETEHLIGYFLNNLVLRTDLSGDITFRKLLQQVRQTTLGAYTHQDVPFERLVQVLQPERTLSHNPLFQVFFNMFNVSEINELELPGLIVERMTRRESEIGAKFDFTLYIREQEGAFHFNLVYKTSLFSRARMAELLEQYEQLLTQIADNPDCPLAAVSLVTPTARPLLPDPSVVLDEPPQTPVTHMIAAWAKQQPDQLAISQGKQRWSYSELCDRTETLARHLVAWGVTPGEPVAIYAPRSFGLIAAMMGVLQSGGLLVLLDPTLPDVRKRLMLQKAKVKRLLTAAASSTAWLANLDPAPALRQFEVDTGRMVGDALADLSTVILPEIDPADPAYIFFTSGTTGKPKGVLGCHKGLSHFLSWQGQTFAVGPGDRAAQLTGLSFDVVLRDIFLPLTHGATLCLPESAESLTATELLHWLAEARITLMHTVPALAQTWLADVPTDVTLNELRCTFFAGEPLTDTLINRWRAIFPHTRVINLYGPTETTLAKCYYEIPTQPHAGVQPVGRPLPQTQALVLAEKRRLCGVGEIGEIVLRTPFRSYGYINAAAEQSKQFGANPFRQDAQDLVYFTGDLGVYRPDGTLDILGRQDDQVKVRGVRIELGEVIATLVQHPALKAGTVLAKKDAQGQAYLAGYVVPHNSAEFSVADLRAYLTEKLLPAMVPTAFVTLDHMPLTPNGKIDRRQLPEPNQVQVEGDDNFVAPQTPLEQRLAELWQTVLGREKVGIHDNFFELGGHSLLALRLLAQIEQTLGQKVSLIAFFQTPTIARLAEQLAQEQVVVQTKSLIPLRRLGRQHPIFALPGNLGNVFSDLGALTKYLTAGYPIYGLQDGLHNPSNIKAMATTYLAEIRVVQPNGPYHFVGVCSGGMIAFEMAQRLQAQNERVALLALVEPANLVRFKTAAYLKLGVSLIGRVTNRASHHAGQLAYLPRTEQRDYAKLKQKLITNMVASRWYKADFYQGRLDLFLTTDSLTKQNQEQLTWLKVATKSILHEIPGNHNSITGAGETAVDEAHLQAAANIINRLLHEMTALRKS